MNGYRAYVERLIAEKELSNEFPAPWWDELEPIKSGKGWGMDRTLTELEKRLTEAKAKREKTKAEPQAPNEISPSRN